MTEAVQLAMTRLTDAWPTREVPANTMLEFVRIAHEAQAQPHDVYLATNAVIGSPALNEPGVRFFPSGLEWSAAIRRATAERLAYEAAQQSADEDAAFRARPIRPERELAILMAWVGHRWCHPSDWPELGVESGWSKSEVDDQMEAIARGARPSVLGHFCQAVREHRAGLIPESELRPKYAKGRRTEARTYRGAVAKMLADYGDHHRGHRVMTTNQRADVLLEIERKRRGQSTKS